MITEADLTQALLDEYPTLPEYDPRTQITRESAAQVWNIDPRNAMIRLNSMERKGKLRKLKVLNAATGHEIIAFEIIPKQDIA